jgi:hypothetical protein
MQERLMQFLNSTSQENGGTRTLSQERDRVEILNIVEDINNEARNRQLRLQNANRDTNRVNMSRDNHEHRDTTITRENSVTRETTVNITSNNITIQRNITNNETGVTASTNQTIERIPFGREPVLLSQPTMDITHKMTQVRNYSIPLRIQNLFVEIDLLGNYTSSHWFMALDDRELTGLYRYYNQMWSYRAGLSEETKRLICPPFGNPFSTNATVLNNKRMACLYFMENMVFSSTDTEYRKIGALHILSGLTLFSVEARNSMFWLYEAVQWM